MASFALGGIALALFSGGLAARAVAQSPRSRPWANTGLLGVASVMALFSLLVACEVGLLVAAQRPAIAATTVPVLWLLHNAIFAVNHVAIAIALLGLTRAAVLAGLLPRWFGSVGVAGALLLTVGAALAPLIAATTSPWMGIGGVGFLGWVALLGVAGVRMIRARA